MFVRAKKTGAYQYVQVVENQRVGGQVRQRVIATLGRLDVMQATGKVDALVSSCARFAEKVAVIDGHKRGAVSAARTVKIGPALVFGRLWDQLNLGGIIKRFLGRRKYEFDVEGAVFLTVLHRLMASGSDRAAEQWRAGYAIEGADALQLHHLYRAMAWLGERLPSQGQAGATGFAPRCTKDLIEEALFAERRDLFSGLDLVFFDTTSIYFEGEGGQSIGAYGKSKDHRPDLKQMVVGVVLDNAGQPICCELWPGSTTDVKTLIPVVDRLQTKFAIRGICIVADRGMISQDTIARLRTPERDVRFILGARMRAVKEVRDVVLSDEDPYQPVYGPKESSKDPAPLAAKEVRVGRRRYICCYNVDQANKDRADREAIVASLRDRLKRGDKTLVGNKGYRKYLKTTGTRFQIDKDKVAQEARYDGKWVLHTDLDLAARDVALRYKELWRVESIFRTMKSILETRPVYHKCDETIRGHVFCSFLALVLLKELNSCMAKRGWTAEWDRLKQDLDSLEEITVNTAGKSFVIRSETRGDAGKAIQAAGIALGSTVRLLDTEAD